METTKLEHMSSKEFILQHATGRVRKYLTGDIRIKKGRPPAKPEKAKENERLLEEQQEVIRDFYLYLVTEMSNITKETSYYSNISCIYQLAKTIRKPFNEITKEDLKAYLFSLSTTLKDSSINEYKVKIRLFFKFLYGTPDYPEVVKWITLKRDTAKCFTEEMCLTREEIRKMVNVSETVKERALIMVLYESAARSSELVALKVGHVIPDKHGIRLKIPKTKTKERTVRLIDSVPYLQEWLNNHPHKDDINSPLFTGYCRQNDYMHMRPLSLNPLVLKLGKKAKLQKHVHPHLFRHSRLTDLGKKGFNERDLRFIAGWGKNSKMPQVYLHYGEKHVDDKILKNSGLLDKEDKEIDKVEEKALEPRSCPRCKKVNSATTKYCGSCGMALDLKEFMDDQETIKEETDNRLKIYAEIMADPQKRTKYEEFKKMFLSS